MLQTSKFWGCSYQQHSAFCCICRPCTF